MFYGRLRVRTEPAVAYGGTDSASMFHGRPFNGAELDHGCFTLYIARDGRATMMPPECFGQRDDTLTRGNTVMEGLGLPDSEELAPWFSGMRLGVLGDDIQGLMLV